MTHLPCWGVFQSKSVLQHCIPFPPTPPPLMQEYQPIFPASVSSDEDLEGNWALVLPCSSVAAAAAVHLNRARARPLQLFPFPIAFPTAFHIGFIVLFAHTPPPSLPCSQPSPARVRVRAAAEHQRAAHSDAEGRRCSRRNTRLFRHVSCGFRLLFFGVT